MLKERFSTTLLALVVAAAIPGSAFAADVASELTGEVSAPPSVSAPASSTNERDSSTAGEAQSPTDAPIIEATQQEGDLDQNADVVLPRPNTEDERSPAVIEPDPEDGVGTDVVVETPAVEEPQVAEVIETVTPVVKPEVIAEETILPAVEEAVVTESAIVVEPAIVEPVAATLTITHRLIVGDKHADETQVIEGLEVGQSIDLEEYLVSEEWVECTSQVTNITLDGTENTIILEYGVKPDLEVRVEFEE